MDGRASSLLVGLVAAGNATAYCEIRAPSACANSSWGCQMATIRAAPHMLGPFSYFTKFEERFLFAPIGSQSREYGSSERPTAGYGCNSLGRNSVGRLYHQVTN